DFTPGGLASVILASSAVRNPGLVHPIRLGSKCNQSTNQRVVRVTDLLGEPDNPCPELRKDSSHFSFPPENDSANVRGTNVPMTSDEFGGTGIAERVRRWARP